MKKQRQRLANTARSLSCSLSEAGLDSDLSIAPFLKDDLRAQKSRLFSADMKYSGKVLYGDTHILNELPAAITLESIPLHDAVELLGNRIIESLLLVMPPGRNAVPAFPLLYKEKKNYFDTAIALSILQHCYTTDHQHLFEDLSCIEDALNSIEEAAQSKINLREEMKRAWMFKMEPQTSSDEMLDKGDTEDFYHTLLNSLNIMVHAFLFCLRAISDNKAQDMAALLHLYLSEETLPKRLKGWVKFFLRRPVVLSDVCFGGKVKLLFTGSPARLTYAAVLFAALGILHDNDSLPSEEDFIQTSRMLPVSVPNDEHLLKHIFEGITLLWKDLIKYG